MNAVHSWTPTKVRQIGRTYGGLSGKKKDDFGKGDALYVTFLGVLENTAVGREATSQVNVGVHETQNRVLKGDLLFNGTSETPGELAMGAVVRDDIPNLFLNSFCFGLRLHDPTEHYAPFLAYLSRGGPGRAATRALAQGATRYNISKAQFRQITFAVPPPREQRDIAELLSDVDRLLDSLDALIAKKRNIKTGVMQQLLAGGIRLPGFQGEWKIVSLGQVAGIKTGTRNNQDKDENGDYPFFVRSATVERISSYSFDGEAILVPGEGGIGEIVHYINGRFDVHQRVYQISDFDAEVCARFVYYAMVQGFHRDATRNTVKATVDSLRLPTFKNFTFALPSNPSEQRAIAHLLSEMDAEIEALEQRRDKTRALKQGMMQQLLTGRTRLVEPPAGGDEAIAS